MQSVERRAYYVAALYVRNEQDALDVVQEAMLKFVQMHRREPLQDAKAVFFRVLCNCAVDALRRRKSQRRWLTWWSAPSPDEDAEAVENVAWDTTAEIDKAAAAQTLDRLEVLLSALPERQRQAFILRTLGEFDVTQTARLMGCSQGSVKTHYFRAMHVLRSQLGDVL